MLAVSVAFACGLNVVVNGMTVNVPSSYDGASPEKGSEVFVAPEARDFLFTETETIKILCVPPKPALRLEWSLHRNLFSKALRSGTVEPGYDRNFGIEIDTKDLSPGFYDLKVKVHYSERATNENSTSFGWKVDEMKVVTWRPEDFESFWQTAHRSLQEVSPQVDCQYYRTLSSSEVDSYNTKHASLPGRFYPAGERCDKVETYQVRYRSINNMEVFGWYTKPPGEGPFPTLLVFPGAGRAVVRPIPMEQARQGFAALYIHDFNIPADGPGSESQHEGKDSLHSRRRYQLYMNALQAVNAIIELPGADPDRLAVIGGSQGGRLSFVTAAVDERVKAAVPAIAHYAYNSWQEWARGVRDAEATFTAEDQSAGWRETGSYFDVINFAPMVKCPVLMNGGMIDTISPITSVYAVKTELEVPVEFIPMPNVGHAWSPAFDRKAVDWLHEKLR